MKRKWKVRLVVVFCSFWLLAVGAGGVLAAAKAFDDAKPFPRSLDSYNDQDVQNIFAILENRIKQEPFNLVVTLIFFAAIIHTFLTSKFMTIAHRWEHEHEEKIKQGLAPRNSVHHGAELFHFLGEVEVVFGLWAIATVAAIVLFHDWQTVVSYLSYRVNFTEALFVVVIMTLASTRPILRLSEQIMWKISNLLGGTLTAWWFTILTIGPVLGSFITEPAAMTISALLLANKLYELEPTNKFKYATLGLLFVNISVGGTLTHFAAPPVLMVAAPWKWDTLYMLSSFGWKAVFGILVSNVLYFIMFRRELAQLQGKHALRSVKDEFQKRYIRRSDLEGEFEKITRAIDEELGFVKLFDKQAEEIISEVKARLEATYLPELQQKGLDESLVREAFDLRFEEIKLLQMRRTLPGLLLEEKRAPFVDPEWDNRDDPVPAWVTFVHVLFMAWTIVNAHHPELFVPGLLFFLGFAQVTSPFQNRINLKPPLLVGFFLGGLVIHGGVQGWWIAPVLGNLTEIPLMLCATILTAFNDNAAITYLSTLVPGFTDSLKYAVVAGAVAGGGLTVIANAPNPAGQSILKKYFDNAVSPAGIVKAAIVPTAIVWLIFLVIQ
jgi:hypothetical protein